MKTPFPGLPEGKPEDNIVYIRKIDPDHLPAEIRAQIPAGVAVWGVHTADGEVVALADNRKVAFVLARQNDLAPVSAH